MNITNNKTQDSDTLIDNTEYKDLSEFYPYYLSQHRNNLCRLLHLIGTSLGILSLVYGILTLSIFTIIISPLYGYACAWIGHFFFEKNKPATFKYPLMSFQCDFIMLYHIATRQIQQKLMEHRIENIRQIPIDFI